MESQVRHALHTAGVLVASKLRAAFNFVAAVFSEFSKDRGAIFAAAIAFYGILSLVPLLLLGVGVFGYVLGSYQNALERVVDYAKDFLVLDPQELARNLEGLIRQSGLLSGLGLLGLLWIGSQVFATLQQVMNIALGTGESIPFLRSRFTALGMVALAGLLFAASLGFSSVQTASELHRINVPGIEPSDIQRMWDILGKLFPVVISCFAFMLMYKYLPTNHVGTRGPLIGGATAGVLFEAARHGFQWYITHVANYSRVYGSLAGLAILLVWIYYSALIAVLGAEVASVYARREHRTGT